MSEEATTDNATKEPAKEAPPKTKLGKKLQDAWHKTVGPWATDDGGTRTLMTRLVDFKQLSTDEAKRVLTDAKKRIEQNRQELDRRVDESWQRTQSFFSSEQKELKKLEDRVEKLEARMQAFNA